MSNPSVVEAQVLFALSQLPTRNGHHEFEHICQYLAQQFICSNILPATGPVSAGGDQGRDFETFRTYLRDELGPYGAFLGLVSEGTMAFICTIQANDLLGKLRRDIKKVCTSGHLVHEIRAFTLESVPVGTRHKLETETQESYGVRLEFHDARSIANLLARPSGFWIAEQYLSIPAEIRPPVDIDSDLPADYVERRNRWRVKDCPDPTLGEFVDLKSGLRTSTFHKEARGDLPFWLGLVRHILANPEVPAYIQQRARYELVVATFRGMIEFRPVDDVARTYFNVSLSESDPALLEDASTLLMFTNTAVRAGLSSLMAAELDNWNIQLTKRIQDLIAFETPHRKASLLYSLGFLGIHPRPTETDNPDPRLRFLILEYRDHGGDPTKSASFSFRHDLVFTDASIALLAWTELMENLEETPLFPIKTMADILQLLVPLWSNQPEWRKLLDIVDKAVSQRLGKNAIAARARDRAIMLLRDERHLDALEEFHRVKSDWWSGETVRGSLLAMIIIARIYLELRLPQASKSYALAVSYIAASKGDEELTDLIPAGLLMAANADFIAGAWCSATELYEQGLTAQYNLVENGVDFEDHPEVQGALMNLTYISACTRIVDPVLAASIDLTTARLGALDIIKDGIDVLNADHEEFWKSFGEGELVARPFADLGEKRYLRFSALGTDWILATANDIDSVRMAERFAAAVQVMIAALARDDLCLVQTQIYVRVEKSLRVGTPAAERIESLPSNDGREWVVRLSPPIISNSSHYEEIKIELLTMVVMILREASLLPEADFSDSLERAFERGLGHMLSPARPYDELAAAFDADAESELQRSRYKTPWDCLAGSFRAHYELRWQDGRGPTYWLDKAKELLQTRYQNLAKSLRITVVGLALSEKFLPTVQALRMEGWLDWHILTAIFNIVMNFRNPIDPLEEPSGVSQREMLRAAFRPEGGTDEPVPIGLLPPDNMNMHRQVLHDGSLKSLGTGVPSEHPRHARHRTTLGRPVRLLE